MKTEKEKQTNNILIIKQEHLSGIFFTGGGLYVSLFLFLKFIGSLFLKETYQNPAKFIQTIFLILVMVYFIKLCLNILTQRVELNYSKKTITFKTIFSSISVNADDIQMWRVRITGSTFPGYYGIYHSFRFESRLKNNLFFICRLPQGNVKSKNNYFEAFAKLLGNKHPEYLKPSLKTKVLIFWNQALRGFYYGAIPEYTDNRET